MPGFKRLIVDSRDRAVGQPTYNFTLDLPYEINSCGCKGCECKGFELGLLHAQIPNVIYNLENATVELKDTNGDPHSVPIPPGMYSSTKLAKVVQDELNSALTGIQTFSVKYDPTTGYITIQSDQNCTVLAPALGFPAETSVGLSHTATEVLNLQVEPYLLLNVNGLSGAVRASATAPPPCTWVIPMAANSREVIVYQGESAGMQWVTCTSLTRRLEITLRRYDGSFVDLRGIDWSMILEIKYPCGCKAR